MTNREIAVDRGWRLYSPAVTQRHHLDSSSSSAASLKGCCCCLFLFLIFLSLFAVAAALVIVLAVRPKKPDFDLQRAEVNYLLISPAETAATSPAAASAAYLSLNVTLLFTAANPNKVAIKYTAAAIYALYRGLPIAIAAVPEFEQPARRTRLVKTTVSVSRFNVVQADAGELVREASVSDRVEIRVAGDVGARIRFIGLTSPRVQVAVDCVIVMSPRRQLQTYQQCGIGG
ncbi:hypothetical protein AXF42_Ash008998 [Apostasia shenzhenica]|uniref:Late embryogenesis abundant protein LEA-2 subgroup domain-containing protein n=1 Tax=Apostasia shenzhenica TaxID=1088818 RepID=A0A2I0AD66_9ASPA|nr:hypothetical protein AXF42_Ash008998 [Apostasia shenzhenica]